MPDNNNLGTPPSWEEFLGPSREQQPGYMENATWSGGDTDPFSSQDLQNMQHPAPPENPMSPQLQAYFDRMRPQQANHSQIVSPQSITNMWTNGMMNTSDVPVDPFAGGKEIMADFRNPKYPNQFYERYASHPDFDELGFIPFRDNESLYNENASWWDEMSRASGEWTTLAGLGLRDAFGFGSLTDRDMARKFERAMTVGSSSKGGVGGFTTNLFLNSGYTMGIFAEMALEEIALLGAEAGLAMLAPVTGGATGAGMAVAGARMGKVFSTAWKSISESYKVGKSLLRTVDQLKDINSARKFFTFAGKRVGNFLNPLENTADFFKNVNKMDTLSDWSKTYRGFASFYRDIRTVRMAWSEAGLEGGMVQNEMEEKLLSDFIQENGRNPNAAEADKIRETAHMAGKTSALINVPTIYFSDKIMFDGLIRNRFSRMYAGVEDVAGGGKIFSYSKKGVRTYERAAKGLWNKTKSYVKHPQRILTDMSTYGLANITEGTQEVLQDVISGASKEYYGALYDGDAFVGGYMNYVGKNLAKQVSGQGVETFLSGFLMGGLISPASTALGTAMQGRNGFRDTFAAKVGGGIYDQVKKAQWRNEPGKYQKYKAAKAEETAAREKAEIEMVNTLNDYYKNPNNILSPDLMNVIQQKNIADAMREAEARGDDQAIYDLKDGSFFKAVATNMRMGRSGEIESRLNDMKQFTEEEVRNDFNMEKKEFDQIIDVSLKRLKRIENRWNQRINENPNPFNPNKYKPGTPEYNAEVRARHAWDNVNEEIIFGQFTFDRALEDRLKLLELFKNSTELNKVPVHELNVLTSTKSTSDAISVVEMELKAMGDKEDMVSPEAKKLYDDTKKKLSLLKQWKEVVTEANIELNSDGNISDAVYNKLRKIYTGYLKKLTTEHDDFTNNALIDNSLKHLIGAYTMDKRAESVNEAVNMMLDPEYYQGLLEYYKRMNKALEENTKAMIKNSLAEFKKTKEGNTFLSDLFHKVGVFISPREFKELKNKGVMPKKLFLVTNAERGEVEVVTGSAQWYEAVGYIREYLKSIGKTPKEMTIFEASVDPYVQQTRSKKKDDERTYQQLAAQFGFDPETESSKVKLKVVLQAVIDSNFSTEYDKLMAQQLLGIASDLEEVTFTRTSKEASHYNEAEQTVIDARYASSDFKGGEYPIEFLILKEELKRRVLGNIKTNAGFRTSMEALMKETKDVWDSMTFDQRIDVSRSSQGFLGLQSVEDFATEAISNPGFQIFLGQIDTKTTTQTKSTWAAFVEKLLEAIEHFFKKKPTGTVLNAALDLVTSHVGINAATGGGRTTTTTPTGTTTKTPTTASRSMSVEDLVREHPDLAFDILKLFRNASAKKVSNGEAPLLDMKGMTDDDIFKSIQFKNFWENKSNGSITRTVNEYNANVATPAQKTTTPPSGKTTTGTTTTTPTGEAPASDYVTVSDDENGEFERTGKVTRKRLVIINRKNMSGEPLTEREKKMAAIAHLALKDLNDQIIAAEKRLTVAEKDLLYLMDAQDGLGFTEASKWKAAVVYKTLAEGLTRQEQEELYVKIEQADQEKVAENIRKTIKDRFDEAHTFEEVNEARAAALTDLRDNYMGVAIIAEIGDEAIKEWVDEARNRIREENKARTPKDFLENDIVMLYHRGRAEVTGITDAGVTVKLLQGVREEIFIKKENIKIDILYLDSRDGVEQPASKPPKKKRATKTVTKEDKETMNQSAENLAELSAVPSATDAKKMRSKATKQTVDELFKEFFDTVDCNKK